MCEEVGVDTGGGRTSTRTEDELDKSMNERKIELKTFSVANFWRLAELLRRASGEGEAFFCPSNIFVLNFGQRL